MKCALFVICVPMCLVYIKQETGVFALFWYTKEKVRFGLKSVSGDLCFFHCLIVSIPMGTNCAPLVAVLFLLCSKAVLLLWIFYVFVLSCVCYVLCASVYMCFVVTCWERADLLALVCGVFCEFVTFPLVSLVRCGT